MNLTIAVPRGCGERMAGGLYLSLGVGDGGMPWYTFLADPPIPFMGERFQGVFEAPPEVCGDMPDYVVLLLDMVSEKDYTVATFIEETRRFGLSRRIQSTFDFSQFTGKKVYLGLIHWKACIDYPDKTKVPVVDFRYCAKRDDLMHQQECIFQQWMQCWNLLKNKKVKVKGKSVDSVYTVLGEPVVRMPSFEFGVYNVLTPLTGKPLEYPQAKFSPGIFAVYPVSHIEAIQYVPMTADLPEDGLPVVVMEK